MQKIFGIIGWIGTGLVFGALSVRVRRHPLLPGMGPVRDLRRLGGPGLRC